MVCDVSDRAIGGTETTPPGLGSREETHGCFDSVEGPEARGCDEAHGLAQAYRPRGVDGGERAMDWTGVRLLFREKVR